MRIIQNHGGENLPILPSRTRFTFTSSLREWLPDDHLVYFVSDVVDQSLNVSAIESVYEEEERGQPPYHPRMMTKILLAVLRGRFSSRKIQKDWWKTLPFACWRPVINQISDHLGFSEAAPKGSEVSGADVTADAGDGNDEAGARALDGSKVKANASKHKAMSYGRMDETGEAAAGGSAKVVEPSSGSG